MQDTEKIVNPNKGGRGRKSDYPTVTIRVPQILKGSIQETIIKFYQGEVDDNNTDSSSLHNNSSQKLIEIQNLVSKFKVDNKVTKRQVKLYELITDLQALLGEVY
jgi:hypothetical protein